MTEWSARTVGRPNFRQEARRQALKGSTASNVRSNSDERRSWYPPDWEELSARIRLRDGYRCQIAKLKPNKRCDAYFPPPFHGHLVAHHIEPLPRGSNHPRNLCTLCHDCHSFIHKRYLGKVSAKAKAAAKRW